MTSPLPASFMSSIIENEMNVTKRNGVLETVSFDKILQRMKRQGKEDNIKVNYTALAMKVIDQLYDGISTIKIDELSAEQCASMASVHYDYNTLAGRIIVSSHQKNTVESFSQVMSELYNFIDKNGKPAPLISDELMGVVSKHGPYLDEMCNYNRDFLIDYFGFKTLDRAYLMKIRGKNVERPQHMWMRVAIGIHGDDLVNVQETYDLMSQKYFTHATPTLFNAGTPRPQLSSCFLLAMENDSIDGIFNTLKDCASISKYAGGIGLHIHNVRATGSHIRGTNGSSNGIVPMLRVFNNTAKYVDQCIKPETIIFTTHGPKEIQNCTAGETSIFNLLGENEVIENVLEHQYDGEILEIQTNFTSSTLSITPQHPIFIVRNNEQTWIDACEVSIGDSIIYPIPIYEKDISNITEDDCRIYGYIIKHGDIDKNTGNYTIQIELLDDNNIEVIKKYLEIHLVQYEMDNKFIIWKPELHIPFRYSDVYDESNKKHIHSRWLNLPTDKLKGLYSIVNNYNYNDYSIFNRNIQSQIAYISLRLAKSILPYGTEYVNDEKTSISTKITSIVNSKYTGILYDLQMSKQHDYLLENGLVHNGGGRRNGSFAIYLEPWHADIEAFLQMRKNHGDEEMKARDLFYALWIPDLFMERVKANGQWTLMCPDECPGLADVYGEEFKTLYESYEQAGKGRMQVPARELWFKVLDAQMETGTPYLCYKDAANLKSNQKNIGTIKSSNLCSEIMEYSDETETAVCNLASIGLPSFVVDKIFDYEKLHEVAKVITKNLNRIIDINYYPTEKTRKSNMRHRPIGIGIQGLADVFLLMGYAFLSEEAREINRLIFETIYHGALESSCELAQQLGPYETFQGSPASKGILQFDMWNVKPSARYDWTFMKNEIQHKGLRNSLLLAPMPTASTSQILGFNECIEPITSNIYSRRTLAGEFIQVNRYLIEELISLGLWNDKVKNNIIANHGSIQQLEFIPQEVKDKYKTVWEIPMRGLIDMAADRGAFICQSQSLNLWLEDPNYNTLTAMHFYAWQKGLKTGIYYLRRRGKHQAQQFTIEPEKTQHTTTYEEEICEMCSS